MLQDANELMKIRTHAPIMNLSTMVNKGRRSQLFFELWDGGVNIGAVLTLFSIVVRVAGCSTHAINNTVAKHYLIDGRLFGGKRCGTVCRLCGGRSMIRQGGLKRDCTNYYTEMLLH